MSHKEMKNKKVRKNRHKNFSLENDLDKEDEQLYDYLINNIVFNIDENDINKIKNVHFVDHYYYYKILSDLAKYDRRIFEKPDLFNYLFSNMFDEDITNFVKDESNMYQISINNGILPIVISFLNDINIQCDGDKKTLLNFCVKNGMIENVKLLLNKGGDQLIKDNYYRICLHRCFSPNVHNLEIFELLIKDLEDKNLDVFEILSMVKNQKFGSPETVTETMITHLSEYDDGKLAFHKIINKYDPQLKTYNNKYEINCNLNPKYTEIAILFSNYKEILLFYINLGADINGQLIPIDCKTMISVSKDNINSSLIPLFSYENLIISFINLHSFKRHDIHADLHDDIINILNGLNNPNLEYILSKYEEIANQKLFLFGNIYPTLYEIYPDIAERLLNKNSIKFILEKLKIIDILNLDNSFLEILFKCGMDVNVRIDENIPLINIYTKFCKYDKVRIFIKNGVDLYSESIDFELEYYFRSLHFTQNKKTITPLSILFDKEYEIIDKDNTDKIKEEMGNLLEEIYQNNWHLVKNYKDQTLTVLSDPVTLELMVDPYIASDGNTYSRSTLEILFNRNNPKSPLDRSNLVRINGDVGVPNKYVKSLLEKFLNGQIAIY